MADEYQTKFDALIDLVPKLKSPSRINQQSGTQFWGEVLSGSPALIKPPLLTAGPPEIRVQNEARRHEIQVQMATGTFADDATFTFLTDLTHTRLMRNWAGGGLLTSCNAFVGHVTSKLGIAGLGGFNVEKLLTGMGKQHCWITPASGEKPRYGDLFETRSHNAGGFENLHVGFSLAIDGDTWWTVEGGQGGPIMGADSVARTRKTYNTAHMLGWVDMRLLMSGRPAQPAWLVGSWAIYVGDDCYFYDIDRAGNAVERAWRPAGTGQAAATPVVGEGTVLSQAGDMVRLKWNNESGVETLTYDRANSNGWINLPLTGTTFDGKPIKGVKM